MRNPFAAFWDNVQAEPVAAQAMIQSALGLGTAFGLGWTGGQVAALLAFSATLLAFWTRKAVTPNVKL